MKFCQKCGSSLMDEAVVCTNCGCATDNGFMPKAIAKDGVPKSAKTSHILGVLSILLFAPLAIPSIILAIKSKSETGGVMCDNAKAGLILSIIALCLWAFIILLFIVTGM